MMGQISWPKSSHKGVGVYTPTVGEAEEVSWCQAALEETCRATRFGQRWPDLVDQWLSLSMAASTA